MTALQALVLGLLQGATEFLPVSSSGHLVLVPWLLGWSQPGLMYDVVVHLGTLVAVVAYFREETLHVVAGVIQIARTGGARSSKAKLALMVIVSAIPGALIGLIFQRSFSTLFQAPWAVAILLIVTGIVLTTTELVSDRAGTLDKMSVWDALLVGVAQALAIAPVLSRSGVTIAAGLARGLARREAARFAFLMSMPIVVGAAAYELLRVASEPSVAFRADALIIGFVASAIGGHLGIRVLLRRLRRGSLRPYAYYCWTAAIVCLIAYAVR